MPKQFVKPLLAAVATACQISIKLFKRFIGELQVLFDLRRRIELLLALLPLQPLLPQSRPIERKAHGGLHVLTQALNND